MEGTERERKVRGYRGDREKGRERSEVERVACICVYCASEREFLILLEPSTEALEEMIIPVI